MPLESAKQALSDREARGADRQHLYAEIEKVRKQPLDVAMEVDRLERLAEPFCPEGDRSGAAC